MKNKIFIIYDIEENICNFEINPINPKKINPDIPSFIVDGYTIVFVLQAYIGAKKQRPVLFLCL
jgi:hypothetical protein